MLHCGEPTGIALGKWTSREMDKAREEPADERIARTSCSARGLQRALRRLQARSPDRGTPNPIPRPQTKRHRGRRKPPARHPAALRTTAAAAAAAELGALPPQTRRMGGRRARSCRRGGVPCAAQTCRPGGTVHMNGVSTNNSVRKRRVRSGVTPHARTRWNAPRCCRARCFRMLLTSRQNRYCVSASAWYVCRQRLVGGNRVGMSFHGATVAQPLMMREVREWAVTHTAREGR